MANAHVAMGKRRHWCVGLWISFVTGSSDIKAQTCGFILYLLGIWRMMVSW